MFHVKQRSLRDRVVSAAAPGRASREPPNREPGAAKDSVPLNRLVGVVRAGGLETARIWQQAGQRSLIKPDDSEERPAHQRSPTLPMPARTTIRDSSRSRFANGAFRADGRVVSTISAPSTMTLRDAARSLRRN